MREQDWRWIFAKRLGDILKSKGLTQTEFANRMDLSQLTISKYINARYTPRMATLLRMCEVLECELVDLIV